MMQLRLLVIACFAMANFWFAGCASDDSGTIGEPPSIPGTLDPPDYERIGGVPISVGLSPPASAIEHDGSGMTLNGWCVYYGNPTDTNAQARRIEIASDLKTLASCGTSIAFTADASYYGSYYWTQPFQITVPAMTDSCTIVFGVKNDNGTEYETFDLIYASSVSSLPDIDTDPARGRVGGVPISITPAAPGIEASHRTDVTKFMDVNVKLDAATFDGQEFNISYQVIDEDGAPVPPRNILTERPVFKASGRADTFTISVPIRGGITGEFIVSMAVEYAGQRKYGKFLVVAPEPMGWIGGVPISVSPEAPTINSGRRGAPPSFMDMNIEFDAFVAEGTTIDLLYSVTDNTGSPVPSSQVLITTATVETDDTVEEFMFDVGVKSGLTQTYNVSVTASVNGGSKTGSFTVKPALQP